MKYQTKKRNLPSSGTDKVTFHNHRGYTAHEMLPEFGLINMNGRLYDPVLGRMLSPDNYVQMPDNTQNFNRYSYVLNNPLKYTDPSGEFIHLIIGAVQGGITGARMARADGYNRADWQFWAYTVTGAVVGAAVSGLTQGLSTMMAGGSFGSGFWGMPQLISTPYGMIATQAGQAHGFWAGAALGTVSGAASGFFMGATSSLIQGNPMSESLAVGGNEALIGAGVGFALGGIGGGLEALREHRTFWHGWTYEEYELPILRVLQKNRNICWAASLQELSEYYGDPSLTMDYYTTEFRGYMETDESLGRSNFKRVVAYHFNYDDKMPVSYEYFLNEISAGNPIIVDYNSESGQHLVLANKITKYQNGSYKIRAIDSNGGYVRFRGRIGLANQIDYAYPVHGLKDSPYFR